MHWASLFFYGRNLRFDFFDEYKFFKPMQGLEIEKSAMWIIADL